MGKEPPLMITREEFKIEVARKQWKIYSSRLEGNEEVWTKKRYKSGPDFEKVDRQWTNVI